MKVHTTYRLSVNLLRSASIFGLWNSQPYLALALWLQGELLVSPVLRGLYCKILVCTTWKGRGSPSSMFFTSSPSLLRETTQTCHFNHLVATAPRSTHLRSSSYLTPNPKLPEGKDRSSTRAPICVGDALLASGQWCPLVSEFRTDRCLRVERPNEDARLGYKKKKKKRCKTREQVCKNKLPWPLSETYRDCSHN